MISFNKLRLALTTLGVFLVMGAFISYLQADKTNNLGANSFLPHGELNRIKTVEVNLQPVKDAGMVQMINHEEGPTDNIAIVHAASYDGLTITPLKKALLTGGYNNLLKADSRNAVVGTYVFAKESYFPLHEFVLKPIIESTMPHAAGDVGFYDLSEYAGFVADQGMQNTPLNATSSYVFDEYTGVLYQNHVDLASVADVIIVVGNRGL